LALRATQRNWKIVRLMITEERRMNAAMIGDAQFLLFPVMILVMALVISLASKQLLRAMPLPNTYSLLHAVILLYGLAVGGFALFGNRIAERRVGQLSVLLQTPSLLPVSFRSLFLAFYVKDVIYYLAYSIAPLVAGVALSIPYTGFHLTSVLFLLLTLTLTFLFGISLSFLLSSVYARSKAAFAAVVSALLVLVIGSLGLKMYSLTSLLPSLMLQLTADPLWIVPSAGLTVLFSYIAVTTVRVRFGKASERFDAVMLPTASRFHFAKGYSNLMAKDWIDLVRSGALAPVAGAYIGPLVFLAVVFWFLGGILALPLHFNLLFYGAMIGFFSVSIYGWLNLLDSPGFLEVLPVSVAQSIKAKLLMLSLFAAILSTSFLVVLAILQSETAMIGFGLLLAYAATAYTVTVTAYLTGLRTNIYLFSPKVLVRFAAMVVPPLIVVTILSFSFDQGSAWSALLVLATCIVLLVLAFVFYRMIDARWGKESFSF
jgi:hypothetical protein